MFADLKKEDNWTGFISRKYDANNWKNVIVPRKIFSHLLSVESKLIQVTAWSPWAWENSNTERPVSKSHTFITCKRVKQVRFISKRMILWQQFAAYTRGLGTALPQTPPAPSFPIPAHCILGIKNKDHFLRKANKNRIRFASNLPSFPRQWRHV